MKQREIYTRESRHLQRLAVTGIAIFAVIVAIYGKGTLLAIFG